MLAQAAKFGPPSEPVQGTSFRFSYELLSVLIGLAWCFSLIVYKTADAKVLGLGADEYRRSLAATLRVFGLTAIIAMVFQIDIARSYLALSFPVGALGLLLSRWLWRKWLTKQRRRGEYSSRVLVVGAHDDLNRVVRRLALEIMTETVAVGQADGVQFEKVSGTLDLPWLALTASERESTGSPSLLAKHAILLAVGSRYRKLRSSMLRAIEGGREPAVDFLNGEIVTRGEAHGIPTPVNRAGQQLVHAIARGEVTMGMPSIHRLAQR